MRLQLCFTVGPIFVCVEVLSTRAEPKVEPNVIQQYPERGPNLSRTRTPPSKVSVGPLEFQKLEPSWTCLRTPKSQTMDLALYQSGSNTTVLESVFYSYRYL